jgi:hypothetical protein
MANVVNKRSELKEFGVYDYDSDQAQGTDDSLDDCDCD